MRKMTWALLLVFAVATAAWALPGEWEMTVGESGFSSSGMLAVSAVDEETVFAIGVHQSSSMGMENAWRSTDGGVSFETIYGLDLGGITDDCDMMAWFSIPIGGDWYDADHGLMGGISIPEECYKTLEFPACMFQCMFQMRPIIWLMTENGETSEALTDVGGSIAKMFVDFKMIDEDTIWACGNNGFLRKSDDFGTNWVDMPPPETGVDSSMNFMQWLDADIGFIATGYSSGDTKGDPKTPEEAEAMYKGWVDFFDYLKNPIRRLQLMDSGYKLGGEKAVPNGSVYLTTDGGHSWTSVYGGNGFESVYRVNFLRETHGWILTGDSYSASALADVQFTTDGGQTWTQSVLPPATEAGADRYILSDLRMLTPNLGYAAGAAAKKVTIPGFPIPIDMYVSLMLRTVDGGQTWQVDDIGAIDTYDASADGYGFMALDMASNSRGYTMGMNLSAARYIGTNDAPTADAGDDQEVDAGSVVTLDATGSTDPDEDWLLYEWTFVDGPTDAPLDDVYAAQPTFNAEAEGVFTFDLLVTDGEYESTDQVFIAAGGAPLPGDDDDDTAPADDDDDDNDDDEPADDDDDDDDHSVGGCNF
jgi:K319L-like, PKD domain